MQRLFFLSTSDTKNSLLSATAFEGYSSFPERLVPKQRSSSPLVLNTLIHDSWPCITGVHVTKICSSFTVVRRVNQWELEVNLTRQRVNLPELSNTWIRAGLPNKHPSATAIKCLVRNVTPVGDSRFPSFDPRLPTQATNSPCLLYINTAWFPWSLSAIWPSSFIATANGWNFRFKGCGILREWNLVPGLRTSRLPKSSESGELINVFEDVNCPFKPTLPNMFPLTHWRTSLFPINSNEFFVFSVSAAECKWLNLVHATFASLILFNKCSLSFATSNASRNFKEPSIWVNNVSVCKVRKHAGCFFSSFSTKLSTSAHKASSCFRRTSTRFSKSSRILRLISSPCCSISVRASS